VWYNLEQRGTTMAKKLEKEFDVGEKSQTLSGLSKGFIKQNIADNREVAA
jgi:hypothetical protein